MLKVVLLQFSIIIAFFINAQCPVSVDITPDKTGDLCKNTTVNLTAQPTNGGPNPQYFWLINGDTLSTSSSFSTSASFVNVELIMISSSGCPQDSAYSKHLINNVQLQADYFVPEPIECNQPTNDLQINNINGGTPPYSYYLQTSEGNLAQSNFYSDLPVSSYPLIITDSEGCTDTSWVSLTTKECNPIKPSQIFTPNGDGYNDSWFILNINDYPKNKVYVFDRWGQRVYYKEGYDNNDGWDARYIGGNLAVSTFYYVIELEFEKQDKQVFKGPVSILR